MHKRLKQNTILLRKKCFRFQFKMLIALGIKHFKILVARQQAYILNSVGKQKNMFFSSLHSYMLFTMVQLEWVGHVQQSTVQWAG